VLVADNVSVVVAVGVAVSVRVEVAVGVAVRVVVLDAVIVGLAVREVVVVEETVGGSAVGLTDATSFPTVRSTPQTCGSDKVAE